MSSGDRIGGKPDVPASALTRRDFMKLGAVTAGAGVAVAAFPGCKPEWLGDGERVPNGPESWGMATCTFCSSLCGTRVRVINGNAVAVRGLPAHPKNAGALCPRGVAGLQHLYGLDRLVQPAIRKQKGAPLARVAWDEALDFVAQRMTSLRLVDVVDGSRGLHAELARRFAGSLGGYYWRHATDLDVAWDFERTRLAVFFGCEFLEDAPDLMAALRARAFRHRTIYVGSRLGISGARADEFVAVRPGTEGALALALGERLEAAQAAKITGVSTQTITRLTKEFAESAPQVAIGWRLSAQAQRAVTWLNQKVDSAGKPGGLCAVTRAPLADWEPAPQPRNDKDNEKPNALVVISPTGQLPAQWPEAEFTALLSPNWDLAAKAQDPRIDAILPTATWLEEETLHQPAVAGKAVVVYSKPAKELRHPVDARPLGAVLIDLAQRMPDVRRYFRWLSYSQAVRERLVGLHDAQRGSIREETFAAFMGKLEREGVWSDDVPPSKPVEVEAPVAPPAGASPAELAGDSFALVTFATTTLGEGETARLPWLQEITGMQHHLGWTTWVEIHPSRGFHTGEAVEVKSASGAVRAHVVATAAVHPQAAAMPLFSGISGNAAVLGGAGAAVTVRRVA